MRILLATCLALAACSTTDDGTLDLTPGSGKEDGVGTARVMLSPADPVAHLHVLCPAGRSCLLGLHAAFDTDQVLALREITGVDVEVFRDGDQVWNGQLEGLAGSGNDILLNELLSTDADDPLFHPGGEAGGSWVELFGPAEALFDIQLRLADEGRQLIRDWELPGLAVTVRATWE